MSDSAQIPIDFYSELPLLSIHEKTRKALVIYKKKKFELFASTKTF